MLTRYAEQLIARSGKPPAVFWDGFDASNHGEPVRLRLVDRNSANMCLMEWLTGTRAGQMSTMHWVELNRRFKAVGLE